MCGIVGLIIQGSKAASVLSKSLKRLEYRGYDSVGIATIFENKIFIKKDKGKIDEVNDKIDLTDIPGNIGIGHTRWATHGVPSRINSHPHLDCNNEIAVVHNGIIENFLSLKNILIQKGHIFKSDTDTEVIPHLIEENLKETKDFITALSKTLKELKGSYALAILYSKEPDRIYVARNDSPLVIGIKEGKTVFCASDIPAFLHITNKVIFLYDNEIAQLSLNGVKIFSLDGGEIKRDIFTVDWTAEMAKKGGFPHYMLKEIHEQPRALRNTLRVSESILTEISEILNNSNKIYITAAGTSFHAGLAGKYMLAGFSKTLAQPVISSEFDEFVKDLIDEKTTVLAITQSGETSDTINACRYAKKFGARIVAITNTVGSSITRISDKSLYTQAGPEIGVAATKTFVVQLGSLNMLALRLGLLKGTLTRGEYKKLIDELNFIPSHVKTVIETQEDKVKSSTEFYFKAPNFLFLGRGINSTVALEGSLKLKEISYIHAEGYPAGESKHGPIALIEDGFPVVFVAPPDNTHEKIIGNIMEMKARGARIISVIEKGDKQIMKLSETIYEIPKINNDFFKPMVYIVPLQLFAYYMAVKKGFDPDKPRNLAKAVTVI
ncbi:MAG: glutamine--fructose-6-phosphate transaminase (isomerizing) [Candidatus Odinarchaeia archaeon]